MMSLFALFRRLLALRKIFGRVCGSRSWRGVVFALVVFALLLALGKQDARETLMKYQEILGMLQQTH
jgi:hypothetical protein